MTNAPSGLTRAAAPVLTLAGIGGAFGLASCCAIPLLLYSAGIGTAWLGGFGWFALTHDRWFLAAALIGLIGGAATLAWNWRGLSRTMRWGMVAGLLIGAVLLWAGLTYV